VVARRKGGVPVQNHKYREIFEKIQDDISSGRYKAGNRLPSQAER
jgi:DNA-binding GntR family transcriptional regulator